jgi:hypothetical protein
MVVALAKIHDSPEHLRPISETVLDGLRCRPAGPTRPAR